MANQKTYNVLFRRKREGRTDYRRRLALLKSGKIRLVVKKSLKHLLVQFTEFHPEGDKVLVSVSTRNLNKLGWNHSCSNLPAAYLTGLLAGAAAKKKGIKEVILDLGLQVSVKGSRIYSTVKGVVDSGISMNVDDSMFPSEDRLLGKHIDDYKKVSLSKDTASLKNKIMKG